MKNLYFLQYLDEHEYSNHISQNIYPQLPRLLQDCINKMDTKEERELLLLGGLGVLSGMMPNVQGSYFGKAIFPNLYCFVIGKYGTGKGGLLWARTLGNTVHEQLLTKANELHKDHSKQMAEYLRQQKEYDKGKRTDPPTEPTPPAHLKLFIPANTTKTAVMQLLKENGGRGIIFETEGDTLADMLRQDYGNFSDILRKAYHHEPISYFRRSNNEDVDIALPALSVVMSGTYDQLLRLVPSVENGLFSRFCFYLLDGQTAFRDPFAQMHNDKEAYFGYAGGEYAKLYNRLMARSEPLQFSLTAAQQQQFLTLFSQYKDGVVNMVADELDGSVNRMGVICFRLAMILSTLRAFEQDTLHLPSLVCTDKDFDTAKELTAVLLHYTLQVYDHIKEHNHKASYKGTVTVEEGEEIKRLIAEKVPYRTIAKMLWDDEGQYSKISRYQKSVSKNK